MTKKRVLHGSRYQFVNEKGEEVSEETEQEGEQDMAKKQPVKTPVEEPLDDGFVIDIPDIPMPEEQLEDKSIITDEVDVAFKMAFVGIGQGGGRIAESFWKLGYRRVCCINTNSQDLSGVTIPEENKLVMDIGHGGAGKDPSKGAKSVSQYHEDIYDLMRRTFGSEFDRIMVCIGAGGGTGSGGGNELIEIAREMADSAKIQEDGSAPAVGVIVSLPKATEGGKVNANAHAVLEGLFQRTETGERTISPLVIIDNDKIDKIYPNLPVAKFWQVANQNISSLFHLFNSIACKDSDFTTFDRADLKDVLESGVLTFGACPLKKWDGLTDISQAVRDNLRRNVLVGGFDLGMARVAACVFIGSTDVLNTVPQSHLEHGFEMLSRIMQSGSVVHRGIYKGSKPGLVVYTIMAELGRPEERMNEIARVGGV
jgi:cell division GTPase FtsZ